MFQEPFSMIVNILPKNITKPNNLCKLLTFAAWLWPVWSTCRRRSEPYHPCAFGDKSQRTPANRKITNSFIFRTNEKNASRNVEESIKIEKSRRLFYTFYSCFVLFWMSFWHMQILWIGSSWGHKSAVYVLFVPFCPQFVSFVLHHRHYYVRFFFMWN